ncbi:MAG: hypothetical protein AB8G86_10410 [Saprospiraceae bacterium]
MAVTYDMLPDSINWTNYLDSPQKKIIIRCQSSVAYNFLIDSGCIDNGFDELDDILIFFNINLLPAVLAEPKVILKSLKQPKGLQIGPKGNLLVVETGANQVLSVNLSNGEKSVLVADVPLGMVGMSKLPPTWKLSDVDYDTEGNLYVPSDVENTVYKFDNVF